MPAGRPPKYMPEWCDIAINMMAEGCSKAEVCAALPDKNTGKLGISFESFQDNKEKHPEFSEAIKIGMQLGQAWWEKNGRENLKNKEFSYVGWFMQVKNRFPNDWRDRKENTHSGPDGGPIVTENHSWIIEPVSPNVDKQN